MSRPPGAARYASIAVPIPLRRLLTYRIPDDWEESPPAGARVRVPLGSRQVVATVVESAAATPEEGLKVKPISEHLPDAPVTEDAPVLEEVVLEEAPELDAAAVVG